VLLSERTQAVHSGVARVRRLRTDAPLISPAKCLRAMNRVIDAILNLPEDRWRAQDNSYGGLNEYYRTITWRLEHQGTRYSVAFDHAVLLNLHAKVQTLESPWAIAREVWTAIIKINAGPLPREIGMALVEQRTYFAVLGLANSNQHPDVYWAAAAVDKQARNRFALRLMVDEQFTVADVVRFRDLYADARYLMTRVRETTPAKREAVTGSHT